jgi:hypothetical protein
MTEYREPRTEGAQTSGSSLRCRLAVRGKPVEGVFAGLPRVRRNRERGHGAIAGKLFADTMMPTIGVQAAPLPGPVLALDFVFDGDSVRCPRRPEFR